MRNWDGMQGFASERTCIRVWGSRVEVSMINTWFRDEFEQSHKGFDKLEDVFARHAAPGSDDPVGQRPMRERRGPVIDLDDDGSLNALGR